MYIMDILKESVVDGEGIRTVLFMAGCPHKCKGCHNKESWELKNGTWTTDVLEQLLDSPHDITISGGDPLFQYSRIYEVVKSIKSLSNKNIWLYTGYTYEEVSHLNIFNYIDVVVDGPFIKDKKDLDLQFRGSSNQRIIDIPKTITAKEVVLYGNTTV